MDQLLDLETLKKLTPEQQQQVIAGVKQQAAIANAQNLITVYFYCFLLSCCHPYSYYRRFYLNRNLIHMLIIV